MSKKHARLSTIEQVSFEFREDFILSGYRMPNANLKSCIQSIFYLNNETINFWTHFCPFLFVLYHIIELSIQNNIRNDNFIWPLFIYLITVCFYLLMSSVAHMMNCYSSTARHICFILDYLSISIYGMGCSLAYKSYTIRNINFKVDTTNLFDRYVWLALGFTVLSNIISCSTRFILNRNKRGVLRAGSFIFQYIFVNLPLFYRFLAVHYPQVLTTYSYFFSFFSTSQLYIIEPSSATRSNSYNQTTRLEDTVLKNESDKFYLAQFLAALVSAFLYVSHVPESLFPGKFDLIGQSHQIFHLTGFSTTWFQFKAIQSDINELKEKHLIESSPTLDLDCSFIMLSCILLNSLILVYYYVKASYFNPWINDEVKFSRDELNTKCKCFTLNILSNFKPILVRENSEKKLS